MTRQQQQCRSNNNNNHNRCTFHHQQQYYDYYFQCCWLMFLRCCIIITLLGLTTGQSSLGNNNSLRTKCPDRCGSNGTPFFQGYSMYRITTTGSSESSEQPNCLDKCSWIPSWDSLRYGYQCGTCNDYYYEKEQQQQQQQIIFLTGKTPNLIITSCTYNTITISGSDSNKVTPGSILISTPDITSSNNSTFCADCTPLVRKIISIDSTTSNDNTTLVLSTTFATLADVYGSTNELYDSTKYANTTIEPLFECPHSMIPPPSEDRDLKISISFTFQVIPGYPSKCSGWKTLKKSPNNNRKCAYTNCTLPTNASTTPALCYHCGTKCNTGCGPTSLPIAFKGNFIVFSFTNACCSHNYCYKSSYSRLQCDIGFFVDMLLSCIGTSVRPYPVLTILLGPVIVGYIVASCPALSILTFALVRSLANDAYVSTQFIQQAYDTSTQCQG